MPEGFAAPRGPSVIELIEKKLDEAYLAFYKSGIDSDFERGVCQGLSEALAILHNPYSPNIRAVKLATKERYENAQ